MTKKIQRVATEEEKQEAIRLYKKGVFVKEIAARVGWSESTTLAWVRDAALSWNARKDVLSAETAVIPSASS